MEKTAEISLAEDRLRGARAIAKERGENVRQTYDALARGYIPGAWKEGKTWNARKSEIRSAGRRPPHAEPTRGDGRV
jgi:hypothetical protein